MRGNILILSEDAIFARMLELELESMHFSVQINSAPAARENDLILVDLDSASIPQKAGKNAQKNHEKSSGSYANTRPLI